MVSASGIMCRFAKNFRTSFVHPHRTPVEDLSIQRSHGGSGFSRLRHLDESDTTRLTRVSVHDDGDGFDRSMGSKSIPQLLLCHRDIKVPDKDVDNDLIPATDVPE
jgi:hypothetical protein